MSLRSEHRNSLWTTLDWRTQEKLFYSHFFSDHNKASKKYVVFDVWNTLLTLSSVPVGSSTCWNKKQQESLVLLDVGSYTLLVYEHSSCQSLKDWCLCAPKNWLNFPFIKTRLSFLNAIVWEICYMKEQTFNFRWIQLTNIIERSRQRCVLGATRCIIFAKIPN